jgi:hypothetical protein
MILNRRDDINYTDVSGNPTLELPCRTTVMGGDRYYSLGLGGSGYEVSHGACLYVVSNGACLYVVSNGACLYVVSNGACLYVW